MEKRPSGPRRACSLMNLMTSLALTWLICSLQPHATKANGAPAPDESFQLARLTLFRDNGGLLYPSACLFRFIKKLEDLFTGCFSCEQLHADSILDVLTIVKARLWQEVGCPSHVSMLSQKIIQFYVVTRLHFYIKGLNTDRAGKRQKAKHLKISRCC